MKDRIVFFIIGAVIATLSFVVANAGKEKQNTENLNPTFETVTIKGELRIVKGDSFILLTNERGNANVIMETKGMNISLMTNQNTSAILLSNNDPDNNEMEIGSALYLRKNSYGRTDSHLYLQDTKGENIIRSTDK